MTDRLVHVVGFFAATAIVVGAGYVILSKGAGIVVTPTVSAPSSHQVGTTDPTSWTQAVPPHDFRREAQPSQGASNRTGSGIYRCVEKGGVVYSNAPCVNGREIDVRPNSGFTPPIVRPIVQHPPELQDSADSNRSSDDTTAAPQSPDPGAARCSAIEAEIAQVDAMARAGGTASYQDWLRARRHKLLDEKYRLKC